MSWELEFDLLGDPIDATRAPVDRDDRSIGSGHVRRGQAGHYLVLADFLIREAEAWDVSGIDVDIVAKIDGRYRDFQVKANEHLGGSFGRANGGTNAPYGRTLLSYKGKIHAFAFVLLARRLVFYIHIDAISTPSLSIADSNWTHQHCEWSFKEMLRRLRGEAL